MNPQNANLCDSVFGTGEYRLLNAIYDRRFAESAVSATYTEALRTMLAGGGFNTTFVTGSSGVGKSWLVARTCLTGIVTEGLALSTVFFACSRSQQPDASARRLQREVLGREEQALVVTNVSIARTDTRDVNGRLTLGIGERSSFGLTLGGHRGSTVESTVDYQVAPLERLVDEYLALPMEKRLVVVDEIDVLTPSERRPLLDWALTASSLGHKLLLVLTETPPEIAVAREARRAQELPVASWLPEELEKIIDTGLPHAPWLRLDDKLKKGIIARSIGQPVYVQEVCRRLCRMAAETHPIDAGALANVFNEVVSTRPHMGKVADAISALQRREDWPTIGFPLLERYVSLRFLLGRSYSITEAASTLKTSADNVRAFCAAAHDETDLRLPELGAQVFVNHAREVLLASADFLLAFVRATGMTPRVSGA